MTIAIGVAVLVAVIAGAVTGFGKRWEESLLAASITWGIAAGIRHALGKLHGR